MNANAKNLPEFKALIERYETITLEEIKDFEDGLAVDSYTRLDVLRKLTGFGFRTSCTLCHAAKSDGKVDCCCCVYGPFKECTEHETYDAIEDAATPKSLLRAYRARARYMRTILKEIDHA